MVLTQKQQKAREWYAKNKKRHLAKCQAYKTANKEKISQLKTDWVELNRDKYNEYFVQRRKRDINFKLAHYLRKTINRCLHGGSAVNDLGCSIDEFKIYIESKFTTDMSWDNYGKWHIDHIKPLSLFQLSDFEQLKIACHYTNLQPLWAKDNLIKGAKYGS
jgi:hypothetical protein